MEAEDGVGAAVGAGAESSSGEGEKVGFGAQSVVVRGVRGEGGEGGLEVAAGSPLEEVYVEAVAVVVVEVRKGQLLVNARVH